MSGQHQFTAKLRTLILAMFGCMIFTAYALGQTYLPNQEVQVHDLPVVKARTPNSTDVLLASLGTILHDKDICCGKDSALLDSAKAADPQSLKDIGAKLEGRHLMGDGRPIRVMVEFLTPDQVNAGHLIAMMRAQHAALMMWNSHLYVVHGVVFNQADNSVPSNTIPNTVTKLLLWDTRYASAQREAVFDRLTDDLNQVQGLLFITTKPD
jgi:hypothetical protein